MTATIAHPRAQAPYEYRIDLITAVLREHTDLAGPDAHDTAVLVLRALNTIPEHVR